MSTIFLLLIFFTFFPWCSFVSTSSHVEKVVDSTRMECNPPTHTDARTMHHAMTTTMTTTTTIVLNTATAARGKPTTMRRASMPMVRAVRESDDTPAETTTTTTTTSTSRRGALMMTATLGMMMMSRTPSARAAMDSSRSFNEVCDPTENGAECRAAILSKDAVDADSAYDKSKSTFKAAATQTNPNLSTYQVDTLAFVTEVEELLAMDVYDPKREKAIAAFQKKSNDWSGKYAPGGSSKTASGRAFYNALNQLAGHYAFNGLAPLPRSRLEVVEGNIAKTRELIDQGR